MDDLSGLTWSSTPNQGQKPASNLNSVNLSNNASSYSSFRATPSPLNSGRQTPLSQTNSAPPSKPTPIPASTPAVTNAGGQDSFSNLMNFAKGSSSSSTANLSLRERQELLEAEKRRKEAEKRKLAESQFNFDHLVARGTPPTTSSAFPQPPSNSGSTSGLGSSPSLGIPFAAPPLTRPLSKSPSQQPKTSSDDDDLFAAFKAETKVDNASHLPPPTKTPVNQGASLDLSNPTNWAATTTSAGAPINNEEDDPFGLNSFNTKSTRTGATAPVTTTTTSADDLDFLGDLARPVEQVRREQEEKRLAEEATRAKERKPASRSRSRPQAPAEDSDSSSSEERPQAQESRKTGNPAFDKAVSQLMAYGFDEKSAIRGLTESGAGVNVQAAANWLLDDAHRQAKEKAQGKSSQSQGQPPRRSPQQDSSRSADGPVAWMGGGAGGEDLSKTVAAVSGQIFKTANSFWKTGQKKVQKAMAEFNQDAMVGGDPSQPKWMRESQAHGEKTSSATATNEAMMLESNGRPSARSGSSSRAAALASRERPPASSGTPKWQQQAPKPTVPQPRTRLDRLAKEDDDLGTYVSPNRRKGRAQQSTTEPVKPSTQPSLVEGDLLGGGSAADFGHQAKQVNPQNAAPPKSASPQTRTASTRNSAPRPASKARNIPNVSPSALQSSTQHRLQGTAHFKRGDYASAHEAYSVSLAALPSTHPLAIILLTNRAITSLKNGEPKNAIKDADDALQLIGPGCGQDEIVMVHTDTGNEEKRDMKDLFGKALSRKAEALEQMERWADAGAVWQQCVEIGIGGPTATAGRQRCQKALAPKPAPRPAAPAARPKPRPVAAKSSTSNAASSEAVERLRKANEAAAQEDDEKFALAEKVDARIAAWRDGKRDNLRALIGSLDKVLWENSGWKKVGLHELVLANKVKISYMKAIAKTHPDKIPQGASTEVRLIAATVFATLNESWDKFKAENGM
ncbi:hypothetical protein BROUX41_002994 [Berkeleyomyces rouxiae]|uniref:uncharacterized protein n=1 Tax=Berkeleyomyces rouxiae TaxID=2035830 RepID=UPI003B7FF8EF